MTINELFPGKMGRVVLTRVALRIRMPALLKMSPEAALDAELSDKLRAAIEEVKRG